MRNSGLVFWPSSIHISELCSLKENDSSDLSILVIVTIDLYCYFKIKSSIGVMTGWLKQVRQTVYLSYTIYIIILSTYCHFILLAPVSVESNGSFEKPKPHTLCHSLQHSHGWLLVFHAPWIEELLYITVLLNHPYMIESRLRMVFQV